MPSRLAFRLADVDLLGEWHREAAEDGQLQAEYEEDDGGRQEEDTPAT